MSTPSQSRRRRSRGSAWFWRQTDSWYYTPPGTKRRVRLRDEDGQPIRGENNRAVADLALARVKVSGDWKPQVQSDEVGQWLVAKVASQFVEYCQQRSASGQISGEYCQEVVRYLNDFCEFCGALPVADLRKGHVQHWIERHEEWRSPVTQRNAMTAVLSAFAHAKEMHGVSSSLRGLKKPPQRPRLYSFTDEDERAMYAATDKAFKNFLFAAVHTGLRPFCELAHMTAADVQETPRGMIWRVNSSKTNKTRRIPVRREVAELTRRLLEESPADSTVIFRNTQARPWKKLTGVGRFLKIKRDLGWDKDPVRKNYST